MESLSLILLLLSPAFAMPMRRLVSSSESSSESESHESSSSSSVESYDSASSSSSEEEERSTPGTLAPPTSAMGPITEGSTPTAATPSMVPDAVTGCVTVEIPTPPPFTEVRGDA